MKNGESKNKERGTKRDERGKKGDVSSVVVLRSPIEIIVREDSVCTTSGLVKRGKVVKRKGVILSAIREAIRFVLSIAYRVSALLAIFGFFNKKFTTQIFFCF